jgi:alpha-tubulin suppressor-like RCC1 family protein
MSTLDLGKVKQLWRGTWSTGNSYLANDIVAYNSAIWICTQGHAVGASTEFSPGKRDRANILTKTVDTSEIITFNVTVSTVNSVNYFFIDGRQAPSLTLYSGVHYRFYQKDSSNLAHRFALSTTPDGIFGTNGTELINSSTSYSYSYTGTAGVDGVLDVVLSSNFVGSLYFYSSTDAGYGGVSLTPRSTLTVAAGWRGYQYWDQLTSGFSFIGSWTASTQYYYNNIVEYQGATYLALADNIGSFPAEPTGPLQLTSSDLKTPYLATGTQYATANTGNHNWMLLANGDRRTENNSVGWFMNKGPIGWPYPHGNQGNGNHFAAMKWITRSGRVYNHGNGVGYNHGTDMANTSAMVSYPQEVVFNHADWWMSRDNGGIGRMTTPDGQPPRCIQIEAGFHWAHYLFNNGEVWGNGANASGYLGTGVTTAFGVPVRVEGLNDVKIVKISAPYGPVNADAHHVLALDDQGYVWSWGSNNTGQLGLGHQVDMYSAQRIPRSYFGNERVVDILAMGPAGTGISYARTAQNNIFAWGYNGTGSAGPLGVGDVTARQRPVQMSPSTWTPSANNGIVKWQAANVGNNATFMILDGNGFLWQTGADAYGAAGFATAANRNVLTKSTTAPAGTITNFWTIWSGDNSAFVQTFVRVASGATYSCGIGSTATTGNNTMGYGSTATAAATAANVISAATNPLSTTLPSGTATGITNVKDVYIHVSTSGANRTITWLTDSGKIFSQGYNTYGELGNPGIANGSGANPVDESGSTYSPVVTYTFPGTKTVQLMPSGMASSDFASTVDVQHGMFAMTDIGQVFAWGMARSAAIHAGYEGGFVGYNFNTRRQASTPMPVCIQWAR